MSNTDPNTRTFYNVIISRFSNVSNDLENFLITYETKEKAEEYAAQTLARNEFNTLHFAVTIIPMTVSAVDARYIYLSAHMGYVAAKFDVKTSAIKPISPNDQDQK